MHATKKSEFVVEKAPENDFSMHLKKNATKISSDHSEECGVSGSSGSSTPSFFSPTDQSEASTDASTTSEDVEWQPALARQSRKKSEFVVETAPESLFAMHLKDDAKVRLGPSEECDDTISSGSSVSHLSSTKQSETSTDASTNHEVELRTHTRPDKAPSAGIDSFVSETTSGFDDTNVLSTSQPAHSVNPPSINNIEKTPASKMDERLKSINSTDKRKGGGVAVIEESVHAASKLESPQPTSSARNPSTDVWENQVHTSTSRVLKSKSAKTSGNNQMLNMDLSSEFSKSSKLLPSYEYRKSELYHGKEARPMTASMNSGNSQKMHTDAYSPQDISLETEGVRILSQSTGKGLKTSVRKLTQHFRVPKQSKSYTLDIVKDSGDNQNYKVTLIGIS